MPGYSDRINHALAFAAKHYGAAAPAGAGMGYVVQPATVALILARYEADPVTIVAGILHHVLEEAAPQNVDVLEHKIAEKFGPVVLAVAKDAVEPKYDARGDVRPWRIWKQDYLGHLTVAEPRALDICIADEIHACGTTITTLRRLGVEYLRAMSNASSEQTVWWYRSVLEVMEARTDWPRRAMLDELRAISSALVRGIREREEER